MMHINTYGRTRIKVSILVLMDVPLECGGV